ncbi:hypothetical protein [Coleofasciculus chthonoplastes]|uniref:hypothetical protein n=1 Tax=Coleofasciculus chthonoplastes TaxID=64178 RepID=UPI0033036BEE
MSSQNKKNHVNRQKAQQHRQELAQNYNLVNLRQRLLARHQYLVQEGRSPNAEGRRLEGLW